MSLEEIAQEVTNCHKCVLAQGRTNTVPGSGSENAEIVFIGEGPGRNEDLQGLPFVGAAGKFLSELLASIGLKREEEYIANVVKCRPPNNREPMPEEVRACWPYLEAQLQIIKPLLVVLLGRHSLNRFVPGKSISQVHGQALRREIKGLGKLVYFPIFHPAAALYNPELRSTIMADFQKVPALLKKIKEEKNELAVEVEEEKVIKQKKLLTV